ncbi:PTS fructose transporter subunit IIB [Amedibacillus sp. YH-ame6]
MKIVAVTSCATGIAHTYMAAEAIKKICKEKGHECKVEMQGALGIENKLKDKEIAEADLIIFANDVGISKSDRFKGYEEKTKKTTPHAVIKDPNIIFEEM